MRAASGAPDGFGRLLALGITAMVLCQALINFAVVLGMVPTKGSRCLSSAMADQFAGHAAGDGCAAEYFPTATESSWS